MFCAVFEYPRHMVTWTLDYCRVYKEPWARQENREPAIQVTGSLPVEPHVENFLDCIRSRKEPNAPIEVGATAVSGPHLANIAFLQGRRARFE